MEKLFLIARADLPPGLLAAQEVHAAREFQRAHPEVEAEWYRTSNNLALLSVPDEPALARLLGELTTRGVPVAAFREPDLDGSLTAIAAAHGAKRFVRTLAPALRPERAA